MITAITPDLPTSGANLGDYRARPALGERSMLPDSVPAAPRSHRPGENRHFGDDKKRSAPEPDLPQKDQSSMFAAAVIAGALPPTPQTMEELIMRIGSSPIPAESQARLRDILA